MSNVVQFRNLYENDRARYISGVGTDYEDIISKDYDHGLVTDAAGNYSGPIRIQRMIELFNREANAEDDFHPMDVDIIGFSRGAAQARDFANRIVALTQGGWYRYKDDFSARCQRVNFRFMGLWDTVLAFNESGYKYQLGIPRQFAYVAQAVALNEYRSAPAGIDNSLPSFFANANFWNTTRVHQKNFEHYGAFPLESIGTSSDELGNRRIERGFIGAHADIGGGYPDGENGLSKVALKWMVAQAELAGIRMKSDEDRLRLDMGSPVLHDQSNAMRVGDPSLNPSFIAPSPSGWQSTYKVEDRRVNGGSGSGSQRGQTFLGTAQGKSMTNAETHQFISYTPRPQPKLMTETNKIPELQTMSNKTGTVDMLGYVTWLRNSGYTFAGPMQ